MDVGLALRQRREALGYTLEDVEAATKIRPRYLRAIEAGRRQDLPGPVYTRGFIRSYANFLEMDGRTLAAAWDPPVAEEAGGDTQGAARPQAPSDERPAATARTPGRSLGIPAGGRPARRGRRPIIIVLWVIALLAIAAAALALRAGISPRGAATRTAAGAASASATGRAGTTAAAATATATPSAAGPTVATSTGTDASGNPVTIYTVSGAAALTVAARATARCWLDVVVDGRPANASLTLTPGQAMAWQGQAQVTMRIGYPAGLTLAVDGVPLPGIRDKNPVNVAFVLQGKAP